MKHEIVSTLRIWGAEGFTIFEGQPFGNSANHHNITEQGHGKCREQAHSHIREQSAVESVRYNHIVKKDIKTTMQKKHIILVKIKASFCYGPCFRTPLNVSLSNFTYSSSGMDYCQPG
ncbi:hypothetical protein ACFSQ7_08965 [Paenibacillus rhizoplanae]